jgi:hypothetical protein
MIAVKINVTRIDKTAIFEGKSGKYVDMLLMENKDGPDQYGNDGFVTQGISKERREAGERGPIIGNWRRINSANAQAPKPKAKADAYEAPSDDVPF